MVTEQVLDRGRAVQVAERLEVDNPDWVIMYGSYSREYVAFPVYPDAPDNSYCSAKDPAQLDDHIRETERRHGRVRLAAVRTARAAANFCIRKGRGGAGLSAAERGAGRRGARGGAPGWAAARRRAVNSVTLRKYPGSGLIGIFGSVTAGPGQTSFLG